VSTQLQSLDCESSRNIELEAETLHPDQTPAVAWAVQIPGGKWFRQRFRLHIDNIRLSYKPIDPQ
jgi:hypothetical protein